MKKTLKFIVLATALLAVFSCSGSGDKDKETLVLIKTDKGDIKVKLYNETPLHRDNFIRLVKENYYDGVLFHRVIKEFMIQTGDPDSKKATKDQMLGVGGPDSTIQAEIIQGLFHKKGALAAARQGDQVNPEKRSSGSQFYIIQGAVYPAEELTQMEMQLGMQQKQMKAYEIFNRPENIDFQRRVQIAQESRDTVALMQLNTEFIAMVDSSTKDMPPFKFTEAQKTAYSTIGGAPHLDGQYTIFGEVLEGLNVVDSIADVKCNQNGRPNDDIKIISMKIVKR